MRGRRTFAFSRLVCRSIKNSDMSVKQHKNLIRDSRGCDSVGNIADLCLHQFRAPAFQFFLIFKERFFLDADGECV